MGVKVREKVKDSGEWWIFVSHKGKRKSKKIGNKVAANKVAREIEARLAKGDMGIIGKQSPSVSKYGVEWLNSPLRKWTDGTFQNYETIFGLHIKKHLGSKQLHEVKRRDVKDFIAKLDGLSSGTKKNIVGVLSSMFESAVDDELVKINPCQNTTRHCGNEPVNDITALTPDEVQTLLENVAAFPYAVYTLVLLAARTGLRIGELLALRWSDIDFENRSLEVSRTYDYIRNSYGPPKNKKTRTVDLTPATVEALKTLQAKRKVVSIDGDDLVFMDDNGEPLNYYHLRYAIKKVAPKHFRIHDLRHTYATLRIAKGDNILDVSKQLGHHKVAFTIDKYGHWIPGEHKSQVDELDTLHLAAPQMHP